VEQKYEYKFVRLEQQARKDYAQKVQEYAGEGWRLVQILAPGAGGLGARANFIEIILERRL
jgi:hypothetical protein